MSRFSKTLAVTFAASTALSTALGAPALAQDATPSAAETEGDMIIVTGTRATGTNAAESAAPVLLLSDDALSRVGQPNLNQALTQLVPSFQAQTQGTDMASFSLSARLRGTSPNHTLVLVNGKRRHGNSILQVINGAFGGSAAPSIDLILPDIVQRIEILQDGAAAVYGSDAIAGVINIILKSDTQGGTLRATAGEYFDGEGRTYSVSGNFGMEVGDAGFLDIALFHRRNEVTTIGEGQFSVYNLNGTINQSSGISAAFRPLYQNIADNDLLNGINGGQPASKLTLGFYNFGYEFDTFEVYSFGNVSYRAGDALQGYRVPNRLCRDPLTATAQTTDPTNCFGNTAATGLVPHIEVTQDEFSFTGGLRGETAGGWNWDVSGTYAEDVAKVYTTGSANASLFVATGFSPTDFYDGGFQFNQFVGTVDIDKEFDIGLAGGPLTVAFGGEFRDESYEIFQGDAGSLFVEGGQSFPGYSATDAGKISRTAKAAYLNFIANPVDDWTLDLAGRFEDYSDFGSTLIGKITTRYDFSPAFALRATASTGFRAPSLQESGYSATNVGPTSAVLQLAPSSPGATSAGFGALGPEESVNFSAGMVLRPVPRLVVTLDGYYIKINDRIVSSGAIQGQQNQPIGTPGVPVLTPLINGLTPFELVNNAIIASGKQLDPTVLESGSLSIQTFTNGIDTRTLGLEFSARYPVDLSFGSLDLTASANVNETKVTDSSALGTLWTVTAEDVIENASPTFRANLGGLFETGAFSANLRMNYYSATTQLVRPNAFSTTPRPILGTFYEATVGAAAIFDLELDYDITDNFTIAIGANNLFDKRPPVPDFVADYDPANPSTGWLSGRSPYINNNGAHNAPLNFGPYGSNGGYYYARVTVNF
ncbi:TonB-dependent receptor [Altererythrobacter sp. KTW20L]|uniref:TonB-dependent receptor plug domain-containing protein n=1 Tax=Altererythrobacter sp. KTW20L TaxID=2942210 RepID=UPI0020C16017|nr:TonB-dependent receptor [Altererythrobacter sp. KTW20L]MCL6251584.1 TonB-dependent receptor [Altererythrobacter sp. KTW20L]